MPGAAFQLAADLAVFGYAAARGRGDLQEGHLAVQFGRAFEQARIGEEAFRQAFGVVQAIHANDQRAAFQARAQLMDLRVVVCMAGVLGDLWRVDADGECLCAEAATGGCAQAAVTTHLGAHFIQEIFLEGAPVACRLQTDQIIAGERLQQLAVARQRNQQTGCG